MKESKTKLPPIPKMKHNYMKPKDKVIKHTSTFNQTLNPNNYHDPKYDNAYTITWFRNKFNKSQIANSVNSLISYPTIDQKSKLKKSNSFQLHHQLQPPLHLNIKYLFQNSIYSKILKLRELFIDFDRDQNEMMEVGEIETMLKENNIKVTKFELFSLFFNHTYNFNTANKKKFYLTFHQFIEFCLSKDQEFRLFMRKIKRNNKTNETDKHFFPMNFNALLDFFVIKGEERKSQKKINNAINIMNKVINSNNTNRVMITEVHNNKYDDINFDELLNEFEKLFVFAQGVSKKKRPMSEIPQQKLNLRNMHFKECNNIFENLIKVDYNKR